MGECSKIPREVKNRIDTAILSSTSKRYGPFYLIKVLDKKDNLLFYLHKDNNLNWEKLYEVKFYLEKYRNETNNKYKYKIVETYIIEKEIDYED